MNNDKITERQAISIMAMFTLGTGMITGGANPAAENAWLAIIIAILVSMPIQLMYARMLSNYPGKNILQITDITFGKLISKVFCIIFLWNGIYLSALLLRTFDQFIRVVGLNATPEIIIITVIIVIAMQMLKSGISVFGKWSEFFFYILFFYFLFIPITLIPLLDIDNIVPIMYDGIEPVYKGVIYALAFPLTQNFIFLLYFNNFKNKKSYYKIFTIGPAFGGFLLFIVVIFTILVIGKDNYVLSVFPPYLPIRRISIGRFFQRIEMLLLLEYIYVAFVKVVASLFSALISFQHLLNLKNYKTFVIPITLLVGVLGYLTYSDYLDYHYITSEIYLPYAIVVNILVPFIIFIAEEIKLKKNSHKK
ncbi:endospore germination permease [Vallitalea sediminicola]